MFEFYEVSETFMVDSMELCIPGLIKLLTKIQRLCSSVYKQNISIS